MTESDGVLLGRCAERLDALETSVAALAAKVSEQDLWISPHELAEAQKRTRWQGLRSGLVKVGWTMTGALAGTVAVQILHLVHVLK